MESLVTRRLSPAIDLSLSAQTESDPLPSWKDGGAKKAILDFVVRTTTPGSDDFVPASARIAVFDNHGTLWTEQPICDKNKFRLPIKVRRNAASWALFVLGTFISPVSLYSLRFTRVFLTSNPKCMPPGRSPQNQAVDLAIRRRISAAAEPCGDRESAGRSRPCLNL